MHNFEDPVYTEIYVSCLPFKNTVKLLFKHHSEPTFSICPSDNDLCPICHSDDDLCAPTCPIRHSDDDVRVPTFSVCHNDNAVGAPTSSICQSDDLVCVPHLSHLAQ